MWTKDWKLAFILMSFLRHYMADAHAKKKYFSLFKLMLTFSLGSLYNLCPVTRKSCQFWFRCTVRFSELPKPLISRDLRYIKPVTVSANNASSCPWLDASRQMTSPHIPLAKWGLQLDSLPSPLTVIRILSCHSFHSPMLAAIKHFLHDNQVIVPVGLVLSESFQLIRHAKKYRCKLRFSFAF